MPKVSIFWFRRDLRLQDNAGLYHALKGEYPVLPLFIFDREILDELEDKKDARVEFIHDTIQEMQGELKSLDSSMVVQYGSPIEVWKALLETYDIGAVYTNRDYEPYAIKRDDEVSKLLEEMGVPMHVFKDHVVFEKGEVLKSDGDPYTVFTPYSRKWKEKLESRMEKWPGEAGEAGSISYFLKPYPTEDYFGNFLPLQEQPVPALGEMGFENTDIDIPSKTVSRGLIRNYDKTRNIPGIDGTSRLGIHFRFGTISIREKAWRARQLNETFLNELIWRDFYAMILAHFPHVVERSFREKYDYIQWRNNEEEFKKWCEGKTGYPIVDAGMRQLNQTGYMHNRVRMITASFLTKHLLIDWRWGEAYFAKKLLDYDLASNNGGWQWASGSGTDAAPYFRIFNPYSQQEKFDKDLKYVKEWVPEYGTSAYPKPIVDHKMARERCLETYKAGLDRAEGE
ncbi:MAG: deoxyribodipyrimidine photo-lyase [Phaeodactylibacter sp.]|nr:deoxyribodipyrimidine photo-lyase [Phaeodactylibacter sp.]MCB9050697.1 deoxyribodipyrimidine photo-lyase [Lewinellaceae bacterium]